MEGADVTIAISDLTVVNILEEPNQFFIDSSLTSPVAGGDLLNLVRYIQF